MESKRFRFSVVMPVYKVEDYLAEAIDSLINQTIGFEDNIQLILVNDGSPDKSGAICQDYRNKYPDNIIYVEKENGGVSSARNEGVKHACGEFINFMDSDDKWDIHSFKIIDEYLQNNRDIKIAFTGMKIFGRGKTSYHLDYQYKKTRKYDIESIFDYPQLKVITGFISKELAGTNRFDTEVSIGEDILYINQMIMEEGRFAIVSEAQYLYRKRDSGSSAMDAAAQNHSYYTVTPEKVWAKLAFLSKEKYGTVIKYIQYLLITDMQWRLDKPLPNFLSESEKKQFIDLYKDILREIDDDVIIKQRKMSVEKKVYAFKLKKGTSEYEKDFLAQRMIVNTVRLGITIAEQKKEDLILRGTASEKLIGKNYSVYAKDSNGGIYPAVYERFPAFDWLGIDGTKVEKYRYIIKLPLKGGGTYSFFVTDNDNMQRKLKIKLGRYSRLNNEENAYNHTGRCIIKPLSDNKIHIYKYKLKTELVSAYRYYDHLKGSIGKNAADIWKEAFLLKKMKKKPIWIISDRSHIAGDNGEALFTYLMKTGAAKDHDICFLLDKKSEDFQRLSKVGKVIAFGSREHLVKQLAASMIISSHADNWVIDPFDGYYKYYRNIYDYKYVFLQHGITKDDISGWVNVMSKNIKLFITAAKPEWESIIRGNYGYDESVVKLTGFARYDKLSDDSQKIIAFTPTWRKELAVDAVQGSERGYSTSFKNSDYFKFYNNLINDPRILEAMKEKGYQGYLYLHPAMEAQAADYSENELIKVWREKTDYSKVFRESSLMITDYSSVAMDFAFLKKPVIYTQFDKEAFFKSHLYTEGYFDYERDGFGPVIKTYESAVESIVKSIESDCVEPDEYSDRVDSFFAFTDKNNCERIYKELMKVEGEK